MYVDFGEDYIKELKDQKPALVSKLTTDARAESQDQAVVGTQKTVSKEESDTATLQRTQMQLRDDYLNQPSI